MGDHHDGRATRRGVLDRPVQELESVPVQPHRRLIEREHGVSKMSRRIVVEALLLTTLWGVRHRVEQLSRISRRAPAVSR